MRASERATRTRWRWPPESSPTGFVLMELARQLTWSEQRAELYHYRTRNQVEVNAILENRIGKVVGVEVKADG